MSALGRAPGHRLPAGTQPDPWEWPNWTQAREDGTFGNRYDDPDGQYRVLYASTERRTAFRECLAQFRPDLAVLAAEIKEDDAGAPPTRPLVTSSEAGSRNG